MGQLALKCHSLQTLHFDEFLTTHASCSMLFEFAGRAITNSRCFNTLHIFCTNSSASDGAQFLQALADSECKQLTTITISDEVNWFSCTEKCMGPLLTLLAKQTALQTLTMEENRLSYTQQEQIRQAVSDSAPNCTIDF